MWNVMKKLSIGLVVGIALVGISRALEFPSVFQMMFFGQAIFGAAVFMLLDAPSVRAMSGAKSVIAIVVFYVVLCTVFVSGASLWPQFDPEDEKGKIAKILKPKLAATEQGKAEELIARVKALDEQVKALEVRLMSLGGGQGVKEPAPPVAESPVVPKAAVAGDFMKLGEEQWQLQECYNCHKLKGEGGRSAVRSWTTSVPTSRSMKLSRKLWTPRALWQRDLKRIGKRARCRTSLRTSWSPTTSPPLPRGSVHSKIHL